MTLIQPEIIMFEAPLELVFTNAQLADYIKWMEKPKHANVLKVRRTLISSKPRPDALDFSALKSLTELAALFRRIDINGYIVHSLYFDNSRDQYVVLVKESPNTWKWIHY